ncbi:MAG: hypothetical protein HYY96_12655 [Candidatus Tectomicrobia bacterium]|nr:hypothetical protein [Candidatus Tectomicrobia bacterium]
MPRFPSGLSLPILQQDSVDRSLQIDNLIPNLKAVKRGEPAHLGGQSDQLWHW